MLNHQRSPFRFVGFVLNALVRLHFIATLRKLQASLCNINRQYGHRYVPTFKVLSRGQLVPFVASFRPHFICMYRLRFFDTIGINSILESFLCFISEDC